MPSAFALYTGGKDSHYAVWRARQAGARVVLLVVTVDADTDLVMPGRLPAELLMDQARLMRTPILRLRALPDTFEREFRNLLFDLRSDGITHGVFGDLSSREHRDWYQSMLSDFSMRPLFPLWAIPPALLLEEQRRVMSSVIVGLDRSLSESYLGRSVDNEFVQYLEERGDDPGVEGNRYHTFVCSSPMMRGRIVLTHAERCRTPEYAGLEIDFWKIER